MVCLNWCSKLSRKPTGAIAPSALPKTSSRREKRGTSCITTLWKRPPRFSSTARAPIEFAFIWSTTKPCPSLESPTRRVGPASRRHAVQAMALSGGAQGREPHHFGNVRTGSPGDRSEEHTSELQSLRHLVCRLLL